MGRAFEYRKAAKFARWDKMAKQFSRIGKEIAMAVKDGGPDPDSNLALRRAIQNAKGVNMPKDNVERAIKKASGADAEVYDEITFEGYAPHGIGVFVECTTNNNNRTVANVRAIFNKVGGSLGTKGELAFMFDRKGVFTIEESQLKMDWDDFELGLIDAGADEIEKVEDLIVVYCNFEDFGNVSHVLDEMGLEVQNAELKRIPNITKELSLEQSKEILDVIDRFEQDDDVQNVYHTLEISDEMAAELDKD
ncbi:MAG: YebC/PmpR family DNA-binding transcriptional regulator [Weeksellaceae bacterium]|nr:YebC/PmpR family DNA-binding transcriptional regulator [Weeksellaceae bacterium]